MVMRGVVSSNSHPTRTTAANEYKTSPTMMHVRESSDGERTESLVSPIPTVCRTLPLHSGTEKSEHNQFESRPRLLTFPSDFLKERLFGLSGPQGNHGESVKEAHFHLDNTPTVSILHNCYNTWANSMYSTLTRNSSTNIHRRPSPTRISLMRTQGVERMSASTSSLIPASSTRTDTGIFSSRPQRRATTQMSFYSVLPRGTVVQRLRHFTLFHTFGSETPGSGDMKISARSHRSESWTPTLLTASITS